MNLSAFKTYTLLATLVIALGGGFWWASRVRQSHLSPSSRNVERGGKKDRLAPGSGMSLPRRPTPGNPLDDTGAAHRCNQDNTQQLQCECPIAASPLNPSVIIVGAKDYRAYSDARCGYYRTTDAGTSWADALIHQAYYPRTGDPAIAADGYGMFYATYCDYFTRAIKTQTSTDAGLTWSSPAAADTGQWLDKPMSACDYSLGSPYYANHYVVWMVLGGVGGFSRSTDGGATYSPPVALTTSGWWCPDLTVGPNGEVYAVWMDADGGPIYFDRSLDGGMTWGNDIAVSHCEFSEPDLLCYEYCRQINYPVVACDISPGLSRGNIYVCWADYHANSGEDVFFCRSTDGGLTWSDSVRINDDATPYHQWWPWMAVHPETGDIGIAWLDNRLDMCEYAVWATVSTDGGITWASNLLISDTVAGTTNTGFLGDYTGTTFSNLGFFTAWPDMRNDVGDVYATWWNNGFFDHLASPSPGQALMPGTVDTVRWDFRYAPDSLTLQLNRNFPSGAWEPLATVRSRDRAWPWLVTGPLTDHARLRIVNSTYPTFGDTTDGDFTIGLTPPTGLTAHRFGNDIDLRWQSSGAPYYRVYSADSPDGPFDMLEGSVSTLTFLDLNAVNEPLKFYVVRASTEP